MSQSLEHGHWMLHKHLHKEKRPVLSCRQFPVVTAPVRTRSVPTCVAIPDTSGVFLVHLSNGFPLFARVGHLIGVIPLDHHLDVALES
ncbi:hypothetical protein J6590_051011 [Homalodisca vitripennis]|nr:hypothetical protein J6590_051011 [Homalodisca vitripennis]